MLYGNKFTVPFGKCGILNINNVIGLKSYADENTINSKNPSDELKLETNLGKPTQELLHRYHDILGGLKVDQEIYFDSKNKWDGIVTSRTGDSIQIELYKGGIPNNMNEAEVVWNKSQLDQQKRQVQQPQQSQNTKNKSVKKPLTLTIDLNENPFYEENGKIFFKTTSYNKYTDERKDFVIPVYNLDISNSSSLNKKKIEEPNLEKNDTSKKAEEDMSDEDMVRLSKEAMKMIIDDPNLKKAFYKHPNLWQLFKAEMKGKKAPGTGIVPTLQLLGRYGSEKRIDNFQINKAAAYTPYKYDIEFDGDIVKVNQEGLTATVREYSIENQTEYTLLENKNTKYRISVKRKADKLQDVKDVYVCLIKKGAHKGDNIEWIDGTVNGKKNVYLKFLDSDGYIAEERAAKTFNTRKKTNTKNN